MKRSSKNSRWFLVASVGGAVAFFWIALSIQQALVAQPNPNPYPVVSFEYDNYVATEGDTLVVRVVLDRPAESAGSVDYEATATGAGINTTWSETIQFAPGDTSQTATVNLTDNSCCQGTITVVVKLINPSGLAVGTPATTTITVLDDDVCQ